MPHRTLARTVTAIALAAFAAACGGNGGGDDGSAPASTTVDVTAGEARVESVGAPVALPAEARDAIVGTVAGYVETATVEPLRTGRPVTGLEAYFDAAAVARLAGPDGTVVLDEGLPEVTGDLTATATPVALTGLADASGTIVLVAATFALDVSSEADGGAVTIQRLADLVLTPDNGGWKITGYDVSVTRDGPGITADEATGEAG